MGNKVRCKFCEFEQQRKCIKKKGQVMKVNKKRMCSIYKPDEEKITNWFSKRQDIPSEVLPRWAWSRKDRRAERDRVAREQMMSQIGTTADGEIPAAVPRDPKHPSTGDLSRFVGSTVEENNEN
jgi:hypothetical protein